MAPKNLSALLALSLILPFFLIPTAAGETSTTLSTQHIASFNASVRGAAVLGEPLAIPCYSNYNGAPKSPDEAQCSAVEAGYNTELFVSEYFGGYPSTNWGTCQSNGHGCVLNFSNPAAGVADSATCLQGSVPSAYLAPADVTEVQAALAFAADAGVPLIVKNSGHDYKGRSSAPNSVALWTFPYQQPITLTEDFLPEGCSDPIGPGVTVSAGQDWNSVYKFADSNNITVVGGSDQSVGAAGGWLTGGGHSILSNTMGLGVDNALQIHAVLPNGTFVTANRCQNKDIFFALRGGGGPSFGIVMDVTYRAHPQVSIQAVLVQFVASSVETYNDFFSILTANANKWAREGFGGYYLFGARSRTLVDVILFNPRLNNSAATASMAPIFEYLKNSSNVAEVIAANVTEAGSFLNAYQQYIMPAEETTDISTAISSRLIPTSLLETSDGQSSVASALANISSELIFPSAVQQDPLSLSYGAPLQVIATTPFSYVHPSYASHSDSSVTPAWRNSTWHVVAASSFSNEASLGTITSLFKATSAAMNPLRDITPDSGAYQNEADVFEPDPAASFWGQENYEKLSAIKKKVDPMNVLTCWECIGWNPKDPRYSCYPDIGVELPIF